MEIDTEQSAKLVMLIFVILVLVIVLNTFYPEDFGIFTSELLFSPIEFDAVVIGSWVAILGGGALVGFFTSGKSFDIALTGLILSLVALFYPIVVYILNVLTLGMFTYPNMQIHQELPLILLLIIAIPMSVGIGYLVFDLVTSALHSIAGD